MYEIALLPGDGIGPEIMEATLLVLQALQGRTGISLEYRRLEAGDQCLKQTGQAMPDATLEGIAQSHACLKAPVGETAADTIVKIRQTFELYANVRPVKCIPGAPCLRPDIDFTIVRENTEDLYLGWEHETAEAAIALRLITKTASRRIATYAFKLAAERNGKRLVHAVHKANVLRKTDGLFAAMCREVAALHRTVDLREMYVDAAAMNLIRNPQAFDVVVTTNLYGDILSDEGAQLVGGLGLAPSGNIGEKLALFEPVHGSAPDIAGKGIANPVALFLSAKMMLEWLGQTHGDGGCKAAASILESAVYQTLQEGSRTADLGGTLSTRAFAAAVAAHLAK